MGAHHDLNLTAPSPYKFQLLKESELIDFDQSFGGRVEITFTNSLPVDIYVADRQGGTLTVRPTNGSISVFGIRISRIFNKATRALFRSPALTPVRGGARPSGSDYGLKDNYEVRENQPGRLDKTKDLKVGITLDELRQQGGVVYHEESDLVIALTPELAVHMGSPSEVLKRMTTGVKTDDIGGIGTWTEFAIRIVDNKRKVRDRFINVAGVIHRIRAVRSPTCQDGVYVYRSGHVNEHLVEMEAGVEFYELNEETNEALGLFKSYEEALHWAEDLKGSSERELVQKKAELISKKAEVETVQLERKDVYEQRSVERKDYYDYVGSQRKDMSDELKWILGITATLLGVVALFRK